MDGACEQALRLVRNESVQPLATAALSEFQAWTLDHRKPKTAAEGQTKDTAVKGQSKASRMMTSVRKS